MKKGHHIPLFLLFLAVVQILYACGEAAPHREVRLVDSLNLRAYVYRYRELDTSCRAASKAYENARFYHQGKAEACNNLGFCAFMRMDFERAEDFFKEVDGITSNELERLIADIGLMKVYQRTSMNKEFYDARNSALRRMKRIREDMSVFVSTHEKLRLNYAFSEFYIVSAIYYYYLQQMPEALEAIGQIRVDKALKADTGQLLYYYYMKGSGDLMKGESKEEIKLDEFDYLMRCRRLSAAGGYLYFEANSLQGIAELLNEKGVSGLLRDRRPKAVELLEDEACADSILPYCLAQEALDKFKQYGDVYQIAGTYRTLGTYLNRHGSYAQAVDTLQRALDYVNLHHQYYYHCIDSVDLLKGFAPHDTAFVELSWINQDSIKTVPEWIARIREQLCVAYSGLGMKRASDYNRNIYLNILYYTRQDKELESRYQALEKESRQLNLLMAMVIAGIILLVLLFWVFDSRWKGRNKIHMEKLRQMLDICQKITASIPADAENLEKIIDSATQSVLPDFQFLFQVVAIRIGITDKDSGELLFSGKEIQESGFIRTSFELNVPGRKAPVGKIDLFTPAPLSKDDLALINVIVPYIAWSIDNSLAFLFLGGQRKLLEKQRYVHEQHIAENKRQNVIKKACMAIVNGIVPYVDRIIHETAYLKTSGFNADKLQYIDELITKINEYNDILALWIKVKQGNLSLHIENFPLNDLFKVLAKGRKTFEMKKQLFEIRETDAVVKADKALTLFMISTLTENARKYTSQGGYIELYAKEENDYIEISVRDNGPGLSKEDQLRILSEKVYDSSKIGLQDSENIPVLIQNKGNGFGLMNCKGIIEKYRKTNNFFKVCFFGIESAPGKGSRFFFRLPKGIRKALGIICYIFLPLLAGSCQNYDSAPVAAVTFNGDDKLLAQASVFADSAYYSNVEGCYESSLNYIDSAMNRLNRYYIEYSGTSQNLLSLTGKDTPAELVWWKQWFDTDYHIILDIRNEAAVAFLALKDWEGYKYNNEGYTHLYKLMGEDTSLEEYCRDLKHSSTNKTVGIILCVLLLAGLVVGYYVLYFRRRVSNRRNLEQVLEINRQIFASSWEQQQDMDGLTWIPSRIISRIYDLMNELFIIDVLAIAISEERGNSLEYAFLPAEFEEKRILKDAMQSCYEAEKYSVSAQGHILCMPLLTDIGENHRCIGVMAVITPEAKEKESEHLLFEIICRNVAIAILNTVVRIAHKYRDIESAYDENRRASREDDLLHVQNMVLDNCLSTIKHETIYYPNRIKQIIDQFAKEEVSAVKQSENIDTISELISYYKDVFTILSSCAGRQLEEVYFKRSPVSVKVLAEYAGEYVKKINKRTGTELILETDFREVWVSGDKEQLKFLLENLIDAAAQYPSPGMICLKVEEEKGFARFEFTDFRRKKSVEELKQLFYPDLKRMSIGEQGHLHGIQYLICKQIIREHDEFAGRRGCRIQAQMSKENFFMIYFTLPLK